MSKRDYYEVLGVAKDASSDDIKLAFRHLAKKYHPDVCKDADAEDKFKEIQEAYAVLSDENRRKQYDQFGHDAFTQNAQNGGTGYDFSGFDFSDIFENIFGGGMNSDFSSSFFGGNSQKRNRRGKDLLVKVKLDFMEAVLGCEKDITLDTYEECDNCHSKGGFDEEKCDKCNGSGTITAEQRSLFGTFLTKTTCPKCAGSGETFKKVCSSCHGTGRTKVKKNITLTVPEGVDNGNQTVIRGKGEPSTTGGINGDLYIEFMVTDHPYFVRENDDIYLDLPITLTEAILGCKKDVKTIKGIITLSVPEASTTGDKLRIRGKGVKDVNGHVNGDMYVIIKVVTPKRLTKEQKKLVELLNATDLETPEIINYNKFINSK